MAMKPYWSASDGYLVLPEYPVAEPWQWWMATTMGAGVLRFRPTFTYICSLVGLPLKSLTRVTWQSPRAAMAARPASVALSCMVLLTISPNPRCLFLNPRAPVDLQLVVYPNGPWGLYVRRVLTPVCPDPILTKSVALVSG